MHNLNKELNNVSIEFYFSKIVVGFPLTDQQFDHVVRLFDKNNAGAINYNTFIDKISKYDTT